MSRCTETISVLQCTGLDVAISGDRCALHLYSPDGKTTVLLPTERFLKGARGLHDCNGHLFPARKREQHEAIRAQLEHDAALSRALRAPAMPAVEPQPIAPPPAPVEPKLDDGVKAPQPSPAAASFSETTAENVFVGLKPLSKCRDYDEREAIIRAAWEVFIADPAVTVFALAQALDRHASWLRRRFDDFASQAGAPVLKPNGKL